MSTTSHHHHHHLNHNIITQNRNDKNNNLDNKNINNHDIKNRNDKNNKLDNKNINNNNTKNRNDKNNINENDSTYSTPYASAASSPTTTTTFLSPPRHHPSTFFFYSAPTSPIHHSSATAAVTAAAVKSPANSDESFEFEFDSRVNSPKLGTADELFLNGQIRPQTNAIDNYYSKENENDVVFTRLRHRRSRSMSPLRNTTPFHWLPPHTPQIAAAHGGDTTSGVKTSASSSRCSSAGRNSKRWLFLTDFLRSKSEGRGNSKFWHNINKNLSFSKEKKAKTVKEKTVGEKIEKRRSAHEIHYAAKRAEMEELKKKTYLPYRQGLLGGCLGFNPKNFGALNDFATSLAIR